MTGERHRCDPVPDIASLIRCPMVRPALRWALGAELSDGERKRREHKAVLAAVDDARAACGHRALPSSLGWAGLGRGAGI